jgi:hypothetical protein
MSKINQQEIGLNCLCYLHWPFIESLFCVSILEAVCLNFWSPRFVMLNFTGILTVLEQLVLAVMGFGRKNFLVR